MSDLLTTAIAEHENELTLVRKVQELIFFEHEIGGLAGILRVAFQRGQSARVRPLLERLVDAAADLEEVVIARFSPPPDSVAVGSLEFEVDHAPTDAGSGRPESEAEAEARLVALESKCEAVIDEVRAIRGALAADDETLRQVTNEDDPRSEETRYQIGRILQALSGLLSDCVERLAQATAHEEVTEPVPPSPSKEPTAAVVASTGAPPAMPVPPPSPSPPPPPFVAPPALPPVAVQPPPPPPAAVAFPPPAAPPSPPPPTAQTLVAPPLTAEKPKPAPAETPEPAEEKGLAPVRPSGPIEVFPEAPAAPDVEHRSEEEAIHYLQRFYNEHSGDSGLTRADEQEFERMAQQLVKIVCPDHTFSATDFAARLKRLKETFTLRKKLHNALTLPEFKAYFRPR